MPEYYLFAPFMNYEFINYDSVIFQLLIQRNWPTWSENSKQSLLRDLRRVRIFEIAFQRDGVWIRYHLTDIMDKDSMEFWVPIESAKPL